MKKIIIAVSILLFGISALAQTQGARVDFEYLSNQIVPNYKVKQEAFVTFTDSLEDALLSDAEYVALKQKSKQINSDDKDLADAAYEAELKINSLNSETSQKMKAEYNKQFGGINKVVQTINDVLEASAYDFVVIYEGELVKDYIFKNPQIQQEYGQRVYKCAVAKGIKSGELDLMSQGSLSEAQMALADSYMTDCKTELLNPLVGENADITQQVAQALKD